MKQGTYSSAKTLTSIPSGAHVTLISLHGATGSWAKITYNKLTGYIPNRSLQSIEKQNTISLYTQRNTAVYKTKWTAGTVLKQLPLNTEVKQLSDLGSWIKVSVGSITGYIPKRDLAETKVVATITPYFAQQEALMYTSRWTSSKVIQTIPSGAKVEHLETYGTNKSWYKVRYANQTGYVASRNFALTPPVTEQYGTEREVQVVVANNGTLNVRTKPVDGDVIGTLANGTVVKVKPIVGSDWGLISYLLNGSLVKGYISLTYTKPYTPPVAGSKEMVITHTAYPYTLTSMIATQRNVFAQSDAYRTAYAYVPKAYITRATATATTGTVNSTELFTTSFQYLKATASSSATNLASLSTNTKLEYLGTQKVGSTTWFKVKSGLFTGYVSAANVAGNVKVLKDASMTAHSFGVLNPGEAVAITGEIGQYYTISYYRPSGYNIRVYDRAWRLATDEEITRQVSPTSFATTSREYFQFLDLSKSADLTATVLNKSLIGKGILAGRGQAFIDASRTHNVNEIYLLSHALLETGHGTSALATGTLVSTVDGKAVTPKTVYNMYGIGAIDGNAHVKGAERAYKEGWFTPEAAIIGGAKFIGDSYINNPNRKQNTLYKMRFNPSNPGTYQYATDISWATKQTANIYNMYQQLDAYTLYFEVPKFQ
ncbi:MULTISPECIES: SH3 domain-containing protein [unclassified Exiguobacterium]|uniref:SH3 domain-containing protein n=1 Tax=unclassified Exiguobacterium TaxID=2644629 RepID=UPI00272B56AF|nr:SH3 domain-containing protein [Exiguobacterium sp. SL-9]